MNNSSDELVREQHGILEQLNYCDCYIEKRWLLQRLEELSDEIFNSIKAEAVNYLMSVYDERNHVAEEIMQLESSLEQAKQLQNYKHCAYLAKRIRKLRESII